MMNFRLIFNPVIETSQPNHHINQLLLIRMLFTAICFMVCGIRATLAHAECHSMH